MRKIRLFFSLLLSSLFVPVAVFATEASIYEKDIRTLEAQMFPEMAQPLAYSKIALPLEGFIIQAIPQRNVKLFNQADVLKTSNDKGRDFYYVYNPQARDFLRGLLDNKYEIKVYSEYPDEILKKILKTIQVSGQTLDKLVTSVKLDKAKGLTDADFGKDFLYVIYGDIKAPKDRIIDTGPVYYVFPNFKLMTENKIDEAPHNVYFTTDEKAWATERNKVPRVAAYLQEANRLDGKNFSILLKDLAKESPARVYGRGEKYLDGNFSRLFYRWKTAKNSESVTGCEIVDGIKDAVVKDADVAACEDRLELSVKFKVDSKNPRVTACEIRTFSGRYLVRVADSLQECLQHEQASLRYAVDFNSKQCTAFTKDGNFISTGSAKGCDEQFVILVAEKNKYYFFKPFKGLEKLSQKDLLRTVLMPPPSASEPFRLYDPLDDNFHGGMALADCYDPNIKQTFKKDGSGKLLQKCEVDTLYSWGTLEKIKVLMNVIGRKGPWGPMRTIFSTRGPMTTFGYGEYPIRIKLKKGTLFKRGDRSCNGDSPAETAKTVYYRDDGDYADWTICNGDVIHSWSHDTKEHYDEIVKDYLRYDQLRKQGKGFQGVVEFYAASQQYSNIFYGSNLDGRLPYTENQFRANLVIMQKRVDSEEDVIFNPSLPESEKRWPKHFETTRPIYWNDK